jgi:hypothetical protein
MHPLKPFGCNIYSVHSIVHRLHPPFFSDYQSAIQLIENPKFHEQNKHIDIHVHFIHEQVQPKEVKILFCPTFNMVIDIFTKKLIKDKHSHCVHLRA